MVGGGREPNRVSDMLCVSRDLIPSFITAHQSSTEEIPCGVVCPAGHSDISGFESWKNILEISKVRLLGLHVRSE